MVGIVVVSHSAALAHAAVSLASEMLGERSASIAVAAGTDDGGTGTDAVAVAQAISEVATPDGVLVMMDLGSAVLSAEMALEMADVPDGCQVRLCSAPFVEGLVAAVVQASVGASLDHVHAEAMASLRPKQEQLGQAADDGAPAPVDVPQPAESGESTSVEVTLLNPHGLHARPAATFVKTASGFDAHVEVTNLTLERGPADAASLIAIATLGAAQGHRVRLEVTGPQASEAARALVELIESRFGEPADS